MLAKTPLRDLMILWLEEQDPQVWYPWDDPGDCACARFACSVCGDRAYEWFEGVTGLHHLSDEWEALNAAARGKLMRQWTYGQLLQRLKAQAPG